MRKATENGGRSRQSGSCPSNVFHHWKRFKGRSKELIGKKRGNPPSTRRPVNERNCSKQFVDHIRSSIRSLTPTSLFLLHKRHGFKWVWSSPSHNSSLVYQDLRSVTLCKNPSKYQRVSSDYLTYWIFTWPYPHRPDSDTPTRPPLDQGLRRRRTWSDEFVTTQIWQEILFSAIFTWRVRQAGIKTGRDFPWN